MWKKPIALADNSMLPASTSKTQGNLVDYTSNKIGSNLPPTTSNSQTSSVVNGGSNFIPTNNIIQSDKDYVNNQNFTFPTNEQLQATDNKKISEDVNALNLKNKLHKTDVQNVSNNEKLPQNASNNVSELPQNATNTVQGKVTTPTNKNQNLIPNNSNIQNMSSNVQTSQNNVQNVSNLQNTIQNDTERFSQQVDAWKNNEWNPKEDLVVLEKTPQLYLDMGLQDFPITITTSKLDSVYNESGKQKANYHNLKELVKQLPEAIQNPLNIVESKTRDDSIVVITDLSDSKGDIVVVSLALDNEGKISIDNVLQKIDANRMTSAYGKSNYDYNIDEDGNYYDGWMEDNLKNGRIVYDIDEGIIKKRVDGKWLQLPSNINSSSVSSTTNTPITNIIRPS